MAYTPKSVYLCKVRTDIDARKDEILQWIEEQLSKQEICRKLRCKAETLDTRLQRWGIDYQGNRGAKGYKKSPYRKSALEYIASPNPATHRARLKLIQDEVKEPRCERCGLEEWLGQPAPLELNHRDGNRFNWNLENLEILCPNCHALETTNSGSNKGNYGEVA